MNPNLKPLVTLRVKDGVAYVSDLEILDLFGLIPGSYHYDKLIEINNISFIQVSNDEFIVDQFLLHDEETLYTMAKVDESGVHWIDGDYDISDRRMVFSVEEVPEFPGFDHTSYPTFKNVAICSLPEKKEVGSDEPDWWTEISKMKKDCGTFVEYYTKEEQSAMFDMATTVWRLFVKPKANKETVTLYFKLGKNDGGKGFLYYMPGNGGYKCWMPIDDELYTHLEKALKH